MPKLENWDEEIRYPGNGEVLFNDFRSYKHSLLTERRGGRYGLTSGLI